MIKSPKIYFLDMGLAAHLAGWRDAEMLRLGPMSGAAFETHILGQILRHFQNLALEVQVHFWRTRDGEEIDFLVETNGQIFPIEVKLGNPDVRLLPNLEKISEPNWVAGSVISLSAEGVPPVALNSQWHLRDPSLQNLFDL